MCAEVDFMSLNVGYFMSFCNVRVILPAYISD